MKPIKYFVVDNALVKDTNVTKLYFHLKHKGTAPTKDTYIKHDLWPQEFYKKAGKMSQHNMPITNKSLNSAYWELYK